MGKTPNQTLFEPLESRQLMSGVAPFIINGTQAADLIEVTASVNPLSGARLTIRTNNGAPEIRPLARGQGVRINGLGGNDLIRVAGSLGMRISGGAGNDQIVAGTGNDTIFGDAGCDTIDGGLGADLMLGGPDVDTASYSNRLLSIRVTADSIPDDGQPGENDNLCADIETLRGGLGNDFLKSSPTTAHSKLLGGIGSDTLIGNRGVDALHGGEGDDVLVAVFGGFRDSLHGDGGWDNFVADDASSEIVTDADTLARTRKSVNRIRRFANPTTAGWSPTYATELGSANIADPALTSLASGYSNFKHVLLFTPSGPQMTNVEQNDLNDCWLAATAASVADSTPWIIRRTILPLGDGTFMVRLGGKHYRVDADLPVRANGSVAYGDVDRPGDAGSPGLTDSLWFPLIEKAMAYHMHRPIQHSPNARFYSYAHMEGDFMGKAYNAFDIDYERYTLAEDPIFGIGTSEGEMWQRIQANIGKALTVGTEPGWAGVGEGLAASHAYSITGAYVTASGQKRVILRNPWADGSFDGRVDVSAHRLYVSGLFLYVPNA
jgi:hypothetical protein